MQESAFFAKISTVSLAWFQGRIQEYAQEVHEEKEKLEEKWSELENSDKLIDAKIEETTK